MVSGREEARVLLVPTTGAQRASRDPNRASYRGSSRRTRLALSVLLSASLLAAIGVASAEATTISPLSISSGATGTTVTTSTIYKPWYSVEVYYLSLVNCTRTGGWVLNDGTCRGYGSGRYSRYVAPLRLSPGISDRASRPYAKLLAVRAICSHFADHDPGYRLRRAGFTSWSWGENIGCGDGYASARASVLASHLAMQAEKATNGGHWLNMKNGRYHYIGVGIWRYGSRTRVVTDFYG
jgi:uncharacterized protein YkwD